ncbi:peptidase U32 family protein [Desulfovibrio ferrophilus]|uniref:Peptidase U32 n=1 Tax=Desulfovibrio ferrophilus TaxID=241368 RepID=A0A2Z6AZX6_9BACT|nr:peptidase U32 family protein [Desulfovibrio ferrophilus]BBD08809.1 peptidase U32 [Desulfovibrio ferrophilus]
MNISLPELLAPAGNREKLTTALTYGADAVYLGGPALNLRAPSAGFSWDELAEGLRLTHEAGARAYVCMNALPRQEQMPAVRDALERLSEFHGNQAPDGLIIADPGVLALARRILPEMPLHLSTQANTANAESAAFWQEMGVSRVNLARELSLRSMGAIARQCPDLELEAFVHGAQCMAISGRCMLSAHMNGRSANQGLCTHPCRFQYKTTAVRLEESTRQGQDTWEAVEEDGHTSIFAPEDLCLIKYVPWFMRTGLAALKIEGRMKSGGYLVHAVDAYATAMADFRAGIFRPGLYLDELMNTASRPLGTGFFLPGRKALYGQAEAPRPILARVLARRADNAWEVAVRHRWNVDRPITVLKPGLKRPIIAAGDYALEKLDGEQVDVIHSGMTIVLRCESKDILENLYLRA